jgi:hypothetical protein
MKMSREIKFRVWLKEKKKMVIVETIDFSEKSIQCLEKNEIIDAYLLRTTFLEDVELMQYTGLKDSEGYEIYEGDIVEFDDVFEDEYGEACDGFNRAVVKFENGEYTLTDFLDENSQTFESVEDRNTSFKTLIESIEAKVIGNIYENPELLEAKE